MTSRASPHLQLEVVGTGITGGVTHSKKATESGVAASAGVLHDTKKSMVVIGSAASVSKTTPSISPAALGPTSHRVPSPLDDFKQHGGAIRSPSVLKPDPMAMATATAATAAAGSVASKSNASLELALVRNLKQQIACLEAQSRVHQQQQDAIARATARKAAKGEVSNASHSTRAEEGDERYPKNLSLPMPHAARVSHMDAAVGLPGQTESESEAEIRRLRSIPDVYQVERSALQHNVESLTKDIEGLQRALLDVGRERDVMAGEVVQYRGLLRESREEHAAMSAECSAALRLLESERALRRAAEDNAAAVCASNRRSSSALSGAELTVADAISQRDYCKLQNDRLREAVTREKTRADSFAASLSQERARAAALEKQLCSALDHIALTERREHQLAAYYQSLSARYVTVSAMLRHVLDAVPQELLNQQRIPSPERGGSGGEGGEETAAHEEMEEVTLGEVRETLDAWRDEVMENATQLKEMTAADSDNPAADEAPVDDASSSPPARDVVRSDEGKVTALSPSCEMPAEKVEEEAALEVAAPAVEKSQPLDDVVGVPTTTTTHVNDASQDPPKEVEETAGAATEPEALEKNTQENGDDTPTPQAEAEEAPPLTSPPVAADSADVPVKDTQNTDAPAAPEPVVPQELSAAAETDHNTEAASAAAAAECDDATVSEAAAEGNADAEEEAVVATETPPHQEDAPSAPPDLPEGVEGEKQFLSTPHDVTVEKEEETDVVVVERSSVPLSESPVEGVHEAPAETEPLVESGEEKNSTHSGKDAEGAVSADPVKDGAPSSAATPAAEAKEEKEATEEKADAAPETPAVAEDSAAATDLNDAPGVPEAPEGDAPTAAPPTEPVAEVSPAETAEDAAPTAPPLPPLVAVVPPPPTFAVPPPPLVPLPAASSIPPPPPPSVSVPVPCSVPVPAAAAVPLPPPPPGGVSVPAPPLPSLPPSVVVPTGAPPSAPVPPTLEEQLSTLEERIEAQNRVLAEMVEQRKASS